MGHNYIKVPALTRKTWLTRVLLICCLLAFITPSYSQVPNKFAYQGVARDASGKVIANKTIRVRFRIIGQEEANPANSQQVFEEIQDIQTNAIGVFNVEIGKVTPGIDIVSLLGVQGAVAMLQVDVDANGGNNFTDMGKTQLLSVPYAIQSNKSNLAGEAIVAGELKPYNPLYLQSSFETISSSLGPQAMLMWDTRAAFRAGFNNGSWAAEKVLGKYSLGVGYDTKATGESSIALVKNSIASGENSVSIGENTEAKKKGSIAMGQTSYAEGINSISVGDHTVAKSNGGIALGSYNTAVDNPTDDISLTDRLFQIGNGTAQDARSNAMTILRNGNIGIGNLTQTPEYLLDLGGRARIRHNGNTAGIHFNNSSNQLEGFVGMKTDNEVGFFVGNAWRFWINGQGQGYLNGVLMQSSDKRLKTNIIPIKKSLTTLNKIQAYHYNWLDLSKDRSLQTGLIAQEVEEYFPELVSTDDKGFKAVNYIGLVPHLLESVKELKEKTDEIELLRKEVQELKSVSKRIEYLEASIKNGQVIPNSSPSLSGTR